MSSSSSSVGRFVWYELMTSDVEAAKAFYTKVVGWQAEDTAATGMTYTLFKVGEVHAAGLMALTEDARNRGVPPCWTGYVAVDDVDASSDQFKKHGGAVHVPPCDIPNTGRFAIVADPQGAVLALFKGATPQQAPAFGAPGHAGWHELMAADWEKAFAFYATLFGWQRADAIDIGPMGKYQLFTAGEQPIGGMFNKPAKMPIPFWLYYFSIDAIDAGTERVKSGGGKIINGPMEVPGDMWIVQCTDPQGAMFALVAPKK
ncbi:VOC family protein [Nitrobacter sp.]|uniref:VOC family protein n=1 Tax=Nitrobacter sp. TaxID=29420 RepID=UPI003F64E96C